MASRVELDPAGLYGGDPDYEDWASGSAGLKKMNVGFVYENYLFSEYKSLGMIPTGFTPAGADSRAADLELMVGDYSRLNKKPYVPNRVAKIKIEVKAPPADYGQASLKHNGSSWYVTGKNDPVAREMIRLLNSMNVAAEVNRAWPGKPNLFKYSNSGQVPQEERDADIKNYPSSYLFGDGFLRAFASYYKNKNVCYIQIQGFGLYHLGRDPLGLAKIGVSNILNSGAKMKLRIRTKTSASAGTYRFSTALLMDTNPRQSGFDLDNNEQSSLLHSDAVNARITTAPLARQRQFFR
jgi:hypothetical protein